MSALRRERVDRDLELGELATLSGVSADSIAAIEKGKTLSPSAGTLNKLAAALSTAGDPVRASDIDPVLDRNAA